MLVAHRLAGRTGTLRAKLRGKACAEACGEPASGRA
jgi:hypothetical protein